MMKKLGIIGFGELGKRHGQEFRDATEICGVVISDDMRYQRGSDHSRISPICNIFSSGMTVTIIRKGKSLVSGLIPEIKVSFLCTNLPEDETVCIELYHEHGTSEQFHSEFKTKMGLESLPSGEFATNALILNVAAIAYNCLRLIGQLALECLDIPVRLNATRRRLCSVLQDMIYVGCKMFSHANYICIKFGCDCLWSGT